MARQVGNHGMHEFSCPVVQEVDTSVIMGSDDEGLVWMTHHLVDLGWAAVPSGFQRKEGILSLQVI